MLAGLQAPASGSIRLGDLKLPDLDAKLRDRLIGHVPQDSVFLPGPLADAVARYDLEIGMVAVITACKRVEIHEAIMAMPKAYDTVLPPQGAPLPFGLMRRLALARAICRKPHVLVLDDPLIGLDAGSLKMLTRLIAEQKASGGISSNMATRSCSSSRSTSDHSRPSTRT